MANSGFSDSGGFQLDTSDGNACQWCSKIINPGFSDSGGFELDTRNANPMDGIGFSDSGGFELDAEIPVLMKKSDMQNPVVLNSILWMDPRCLVWDFFDSGGFELDTRDSNSKG